MGETTFVRVRSHRATGRLKQVLDVDQLEWFWNPWDGGGFAEIPADRLDDARTIPGVTKARPKRDLLRCWS